MRPSLRPAILAFLLILQSTGCAYHGEIRPNFYQAAPAPKKMPFRVAVVTEKNFSAQTYRWDNVTPSTLSLQPALNNALVSQMSTLFDHVTVLQDTTTVSGLDFLITPSLIKGDPGSLKIVIEDAVTRKIISTYANSTQVQALCPVLNCAIPVTLSIFSACILCPVTVPWATQGDSESMMSAIEAAITKNISEIAKKIETDGPLLAARGVSIPAARPATSGGKS